MRVLVIDNNMDRSDWGSQDINRFAAGLQGVRFDTRRGPQEDLPNDFSIYDRIVISGSRARIQENAQWIENQISSIRDSIERGTPILGICFGHQVLGRMYGGIESVGISDTPEFGWTEVETLQPSPILEGLPKKFISFSSHYDEVQEAPKEFDVFARSERCAIQGFVLRGKPVYGVQFHPEKLPHHEESIRKELKQKKELQFLYKKFKYDERVGQTIFKNFLELGHA